MREHLQARFLRAVCRQVTSKIDEVLDEATIAVPDDNAEEDFKAAAKLMKKILLRHIDTTAEQYLEVMSSMVG
ncbi:MAG: hypothetical protein IJX77_07845 [Ruminococcus sp.]|nr:hypothetical protein [Ruminococcus sp.]